MQWLDLGLIGIVSLLAWRLYRLELKVEALEHTYNQLATLFDERSQND